MKSRSTREMTSFIIFEYDFLKNEITDQKLFANNQQNSDVFNFPNKIGSSRKWQFSLTLCSENVLT